jgi:hypothetical protein
VLAEDRIGNSSSLIVNFNNPEKPVVSNRYPIGSYNQLDSLVYFNINDNLA